ncbi:MAG: hypothetical protein JOZ24_08635, partial [Candidatus Eremiobacteraeota bacterium]|nr:hypothetical protein [Candidatus Eremiobacteraeota bacterium]
MPPLNCGNLELTLNQGTRAARSLSAPDHETAYEVLLKGHAYEFVDGEPIFDRTATQLDDIQQNLEDYLSKHKKPIIVIHFHGGLVDRCNGYTGAASLLGAYEGAGAFPIFPIYNVGIGESIDKG